MREKNAKKDIVSRIQKQKDILFGKLSDKLTCEMKMIEWKKVEISAKTYGLVGPERDWRYVRDVLWQNLKRTTLHKFDNTKKSISEYKLTDIDHIIIDIIGKDSLGINELNEPFGKLPIKSKIELSLNNDTTTFTPNVIIEDSNSSIGEYTNSINSKPKRNAEKLENQQEDEELLDLQKKRLKLEIYNLKLDALKKERVLNLSLSQFTKDLRDKNDYCCSYYRNN